MGDVKEVIASDYIKELKSGAWKKQCNRMSDGFIVEIYWTPWIGENEKQGHWEKEFATEKEAYAFYESLDNMVQVKRELKEVRE